MSRQANLQPFLEQMLQLQIFRQFIEERLELLNSGKGFSDEFELESVAFTERYNKKLKSSAINNVKRESAALAKAVKEKANPAMKKAVKSVKAGGQMAKSKAKDSYKDVKSRFKEQKEELGDDGTGSQSAPSSPTLPRPSTNGLSQNFLTRNNTELGFPGRVLKYEKFDPPDQRRDFSPELEELPRLEYNLMSDLEEILQRNKVSAPAPAPNHAPTREPLPPPGSSATATLPASYRQRTSRAGPGPVTGDLISLEGGQQELQGGPVVFDPLAEVKTHRKLSRTGREETAGPGGPEFQQFLTSLAAPAPVPARASDDLLHEYGLNFPGLGLGGPGPPPVPPRPGGNPSFLHSRAGPLLADLDPLAGPPPLQPPSVPPRTKKQWTTFD